MTNKKCIIVLYTKGVYDKPAFAVKEYIQKVYKDCAVVMFDDEHYQKAWKAKAVKRSYVACVRNAPWLYNAYSFFADSRTDKKAIRNARKIEKEKEIITEAEQKPNSKKSKFMRNAILRFNPEMILCLTPKAMVIANKARKTTASKCKIFAFNTDYCLNKRFVSSGCDGYIVSTDFTKQQLISCNVDEKIIKVIDLPLPRECFKEYNRKAVQEEFKIAEKDLPTYLITGGRYGASYTKQVFDLLSPFSDKLNLIVATGGNIALSKYISTAGKSIEKSRNIYMVESIDNFSMLYSLADIVFCAPTPATTFEVLARGIPCLLMMPTGQLEKGNYNYLTSNELCLRADNKALTEIALEKTAELDLAVLKKRMKSFAHTDGVIELGDNLYDITVIIKKEFLREIEEKEKLMIAEQKEKLEKEKALEKQ